MGPRFKSQLHLQAGPRGSDGEEPALHTYSAAETSVSCTTITIKNYLSLKFWGSE